MYKDGKVWLSRGNHHRREDGVCAMEYVSYLAGERHCDRPQCVDRGLAALGRELNDTMDDESRQLLKPHLVRTLGTAGDGQSEARIYMCLNWMAREPVRIWAEALGDARILDVLAKMPTITDGMSCRDVGGILTELMRRMDVGSRHVVAPTRCPLRTLIYATCQAEKIDSYPYQAGSSLMELSETFCVRLKDILCKKHMNKHGYVDGASPGMRVPVGKIQASLVQLFGDLCDPGGIHDIPDPLGYELELYDAACSREPVASLTS